MNLQQLPRKDKAVKGAFIPKLDYLLFADYDQIEMRVLAYYMAMLGDDSMAQVLIRGDDLHVESAQGIFQIDREPLDAERQLGKNMNFSMVYGGGKPAVMRYLTEFNMASPTKVPVTWKYAGLVLERFHDRWPGIQRVIHALEASYRRGHLKTIAGAHLHPDSHHKMLNAVVQSSAAEFMRRALRHAHRELNGQSHLVCVVHDELVFDCANDERVEIFVPGWMDCFPEVSEVLPITVSLERSFTNWADKKEFDV